MWKISCADLGDSSCHFEATGQTAEEAKQKLMEHAKAAHADKLAGMSEVDKASMMKMVDEKVHEG